MDSGFRRNDGGGAGMTEGVPDMAAGVPGQPNFRITETTLPRTSTLSAGL